MFSIARTLSPLSPLFGSAAVVGMAGGKRKAARSPGDGDEDVPDSPSERAGYTCLGDGDHDTGGEELKQEKEGRTTSL